MRLKAIPKGTTTSAADLIGLAQAYGAHFRVTAKREIFLRGSRKLPADLLERLREHQRVIREHVIQTATSFVWSVSVDGKNVRVIDPSRETQTEFENSMAMQFGKHRVQSCRRLWPGEKPNE